MSDLVLSRPAIIRELERRKKATSSLADFARFVLDFEPARHHMIICEMIDSAVRGGAKRIIINSPPGSAKSTYVSYLAPAFWLGNKPTDRIIATSHTADLAEDWGKKVRNLIMDPVYNKIFPNTQIREDTRAALKWATSQNGEYVGVGVEGNIAGKRANLLLVDDAYKNRATARNKGQRQKIQDWFFADAYTRLLPGGVVVQIQTRWHPDDLAGVCIERSNAGTGDKYELIVFEAICETPGRDVLGRKIGEALWPEWQSVKELEAIKSNQSPEDWASLYQQRPIPGEGTLVEKGWFQEYETPPEQLNVFLSVDTAMKPDQMSDYSVILVMGKTPSGDFYVLDMWRERARIQEIQAAIYTLSKRYNSSSVLIEDKGSGTSIIQLNAGRNLSMVPISPQKDGDKIFRMERAVPVLNSGRVFLPRIAGWKNDFMSEVLEFPYGANDDIPDALSQGINYWNKLAKRKRRMGKLRV